MLGFAPKSPLTGLALFLRDMRMDITASTFSPAANAQPSARAQFIRRTYSHLAGAVLAFIGLTGLLVNSPAGEAIAQTFLGTQFGWLLVLGGFMGVSWLANSWAQNSQSTGMQYAGLGLYVVAEAIIFTPLLYIAASFAPQAIQQAGIVTLAMFGGISAVAFVTRKDFSFLGPILAISGMVALGVIVAGILFGFDLGVFFSGVMVLFASGAILYDTSNIMHHYRTDQHVAASLSLFASVALLFWYVLRIFLAFARD